MTLTESVWNIPLITVTFYIMFILVEISVYLSYMLSEDRCSTTSGFCHMLFAGQEKSSGIAILCGKININMK
jgi:hypothetical protein